MFHCQIWNRNGNMKKNVHFVALFPWNFALITHNAPSSVNPSIHIPCCYWYSRIYLFTFNDQIYIQKISLLTFTSVFLIHDYICSHLRDVFIHIQRVAFIHIHDRNIHSAFSAHHFCASVGPSCRSTISEHNMADEGWPKTYDPKHKCYMG